MSKFYEADRNKYKKGNKESKNFNKSAENMSHSEKWRKQVKLWTSFYRENPHRFAKDYLGLNLHLFQLILLALMDKYSFFMWVASRGIGKSFIIAIYCCIRCILYPSTKVIVASGTKGQAKLIVTQKIEKELMNMSPNLNKEISSIRTSNNQIVVTFRNGSSIEAVTSTDSSRGYRGNILILDEFRLIDKDVVNKVLRPFLNVVRTPKYMTLPEYRDYPQEENKEIYISSAYYKNNWMWDSFKSFKNSMLAGKDYFCCANDYKLPMYHGLLSKKRIAQVKSEDDFDPISFYMEYETLFFGQNENAFFELEDLNKARTLKKPFTPIENSMYEELKNKRKEKKRNGEIRIIGCDVALMGGSANDNTVFTCMRLIPEVDGYTRIVPYIEAMNGQHSTKQAVRLKQLFEDFQADYVALDTYGNGMSIYDDLVKVLEDDERGVEYEAWTAFNDDEMAERALSDVALPVIFSIKANQTTNHEMATGMRSVLKKRKLKLPINHLEAKDSLMSRKNYNKLSTDEKIMLEMPFIQTSILINEMVNLEGQIVSGKIKLTEPSGMRKDRWSSLSYSNFLAMTLERKLLKKKRTKRNWKDYMLY